MSSESTRGLKDLTADLLARVAKSEVVASVASPDHAVVLTALCAARRESSLLLVVPTTTARDRAAALVRYLLENGPVPYVFPRWPRGAESPYEDVVESPFAAAARTGALGSMSLLESPFAMVLDAASVSRRVLPFDAYMDGVYRLAVGRELDLTELADHLVRAGFRRTSTVGEVGEFAVRGGVVDVYSPLSEEPVRLELDGDEIATLRVFDPASQRSRRSLSHGWIVPAWEVPSAPGELREALIRVRDLASTRGVSSSDVAAMEAELDRGRLPVGFSAMLPALHGGMDLPTAYLADGTLVSVLDPEGCRAAADAALDALGADFQERGEEARLTVPPGNLAAGGEEALKTLSHRPGTLFLAPEVGEGVLGPPSELSRSADMALATAADVPVRDRVNALGRWLRSAEEAGQRVLITCPTEAESRRVSAVLTAEGFEPGQAGRHGLSEILRVGQGVRVGIGRLRDAFGIDLLGVLVVPSETVFGVKDALAVRKGDRRRVKRLREYRELTPGDLVIHRLHGIGRFGGLEELEGAHGRTTECLVLTYKGGDRLLVPVDRADLLDRYTAPEEGAARKLDRLGGQAWKKRKTRAKKAARRIAHILEAIYARRVSGTTHAFGPPDGEFREFEATFPYETTTDQERAIEEILDDMGRDTPMDRLVCGDVGFGKTEVAVRAAYKAAMEGKQVAILVPTTLLAEQHRLTFAARLRQTPVVVESLSRFKSSIESRRVLEGLKTGGVDVVIGTHRILSKDVKFLDLGLLVVDEEHRFGVVHKERLREIAATVHTLTLTATPIPRTLHMALAGIRDLSIISTPPRDRLAVRTFVARNSRELMRSAILRELNRGGQVFVVHNRVQDIYDFAQTVSASVPEAGVVVAHGQMSSTDLEGVMTSFIRGDKDVLVCTTIIESGLDIGTANTMLIHNAGSCGLADLYQLRGRVGRATEQAYCYLLVQDTATMTGEVRKRIEAIERFSELASGFNLATLDLEIRGAGNVLGAEQSGHMASVGYELFMEMLGDAINELSGEEVEERVDTELRYSLEARLTRDFIPDEKVRLRLYRRLSSAPDLGELDTLSAELADRFGGLPAPVRRLVALMRLRVLSRGLGLKQLGIGDKTLEFVAATGHEASIDRLELAAASAGYRMGPRRETYLLKVILPGAGANPLEVGEVVLHAASVDDT